MLKIVRIVTFLVAFFAIIISVTYVNPKKEINLAYSAYEIGDFDKAMRHARRAFLFTHEKKIKISALLLESDICISQNRYDKALGYLDKSLKVYGRCTQCLLKRGFVYFVLGKYNLSAKDIENGLKSIKTISEDRLSYYLSIKGLSYCKMKLYKEAKNCQIKALELDIENPVAYILTGCLLKDDDKYEAYKNAKKAFALGVKKFSYFNDPIGKAWLKEIEKIQSR